MLPSRGLRPAQFVPVASRQSIALRSNASRQYSSLHRAAALSTPSCRSNPLQSARWRTGASPSSYRALTASSVRYGSWYAPWSWGKSSAPASDAVSGTSPDAVPIAEYTSRPVSEFATQHAAQHAQSAVTTATPEIAPAAIDKAAVLDGASYTAGQTAETASNLIDAQTMDQLLSMDVSPSSIATAQIDPTRLIDHAGHLKELGLDYGWGMTTIFEKAIESIYLTTGLGWAGSIALAGVGVRCVTFYFQARSSDNMAVLASMKPVTQPIQDKMEEAIARGDVAQTNLLRMQQSEVMKPYVGSMASMAGFMVVQAWVGFSAFRFLRAMGELPVPGMAHDGLLWFADLTVKDPYFILPVATTAIMYTVFKTGGETGITENAGAGAQRATIMSGMAIFIGVITAFQPAGLQLYFLVSGILGGITGWLLRQNGFRKLIGIRPIPTPESVALFSRVARGEIKLDQIKTPDGKIRYQAPNTQTPLKNKNNKRNVSTTVISGIRVKPGTPVPAHLRPAPVDKPDADGPPSRDYDFEQGAAGKPLKEKLDYYRRNYRLSFVARRMAMGFEKSMRSMGLGGKKIDVEAEKKKRKAQEWEVERRRRFENRK
ncbi:hypothetical protein T440DRAFT_467156 [Plenodomus tracheiphilus IPT5]|uniref:Membrane insertase YidC/Oxa/ALB C-terminal domain-containing protein n=1 Tax=Plenodomus tracheiphilus IPT5 TaxID=1408161 RepID=A0A6A7B9M4_9PLEO|nr:hypothetical protein T440DRAFT_467156 [Plenodomus tracheiphilus IPT5]